MEIKVINEYNLTLSREEFVWLKGYTQNSFYNCPKDEATESRKMYQRFWEMLDKIK